VVTTGLARQTKNVDSGDIEALNSEELGSQMDVDAGQGSRTGQFFLTFCACSSKADLAHANGTVIAQPASDSETTELHVSRDAKTIRDTKSRAAKQIISRCTKVQR
jgi:hypothetical protein